MTLAEIADRSRQEAAKWVDRIARRPAGGLTHCALGAGDVSAAFELFRDAAPRRFFAGVETADAAEALRENFPSACCDVVAAANMICTRRFDLLGYQGLSFGESVDWHLDPVAGRRAPAEHWSRIDPLNPLKVGDAKVVWELNRHQWLIPLAQAYWLTNDNRYAREAVDLVDHWSRANPYGLGINWSSSLEVAYRVISWTWVFVLLRDAAVLSPDEFGGLLSLIRTHAAHIERYLSRYFSPNTHLTGEALGLFYVGTLFPEFPDSARWRSLGRQILIDECDRQIYRDGVYFEQATCYQRYTIEIYLHFLILADRNGVAVPAPVRNRVERMLEFLLAVSGPHGTMPQIGDADGGAVLPLANRGPNDCRGVLATAAAFLGRKDFAWAASGPAPELLWLLGVSGWQRFMRLHERAPRGRASRLFRDGGYAVLLSGEDRQAHQLIFDVGPLGCPNSAAHGHADLLSLQCTAFGEPYLVDPGTYCYTPEMNWRNYFRGTSAHSTVVVDGASQALPSGPFGWQTRPSGQLRAWKSTEISDYVDASHDGYTRLSDPVVHRRRVLFVKPRYWIVVDDLMGGAEHDVELRFQFAARPVHMGPGLWTAALGSRGEGLWMVPFASVPLAGRVAEGRMNPTEGWLSTHYGRRQPAPVVVYTTRHQFPIRIATLLLPVDKLSQVPPHVEALRDAAGALTGLVLTDARETVRFDDDDVVVEQSERLPNLAGAYAE
jgi:uncharacterized heparinase superfamily protein